MKKQLFSAAFLSFCLFGAALAGMPVSVDGIYPDSGPAGTSVIIKGRGFSLGDTHHVWSADRTARAVPGSVTFGGVPAEIRMWQDDMIVVIVPPEAVSGGVTVSLRSGIVVPGNHFEITDEEGASTPLRHDYAFLEKSGGVSDYDMVLFSRGIYPYAGYFYGGGGPRMFRNVRCWDYAQGCRTGGFYNHFLVSGPMMGLCYMNTGMDDVAVFDDSFYGNFQERRDYFHEAVSTPVGRSPGQSGQPKRHYAFLGN